MPNDGKEKLQKAINLTIDAGYQLDRSAFEFLTIVATTEDPIAVINRAIETLSHLCEKPSFIGRRFLEELLQKPEAGEEDVGKPPDSAVKEQADMQTTYASEGKSLFHPYAKDVEPDINVIQDPNSRLETNGSIEDFIEYFQDRFKRTERLLRQRIDVKSASSVTDALRSQPSTKLKIICMIAEKRESKQRIIMAVEDLQASATVLLPQNVSEELRRKTRMLLLDQVVCLSVVRTRSPLLILEDVILPEVGQKLQHRAKLPLYAVLTSDIHIGSAKFQREAFNRFILWLNGKYGDDRTREVASHVKYVLVAGDIVDGIGIYPNQVKELTIKDIYRQYRLAAKYIEQIPDYIEIVIIPGNHDAVRKSSPQPPISSKFLETLQGSSNIHSLGNPCYLSLHGVEVLMDHGRSLDDIMSTIPGMEHNSPEKAMRLLLQSRHLAPVYGGKTLLAAGRRDSLVVERVPDIFHAGHIHTLGYTNYRGVLLVNSGGWQEQTDYMRRLGLNPTPGKVPLVNLQTLEVTVLPFM